MSSLFSGFAKAVPVAASQTWMQYAAHQTPVMLLASAVAIGGYGMYRALKSNQNKLEKDTVQLGKEMAEVALHGKKTSSDLEKGTQQLLENAQEQQIQIANSLDPYTAKEKQFNQALQALKQNKNLQKEKNTKNLTRFIQEVQKNDQERTIRHLSPLYKGLSVPVGESHYILHLDSKLGGDHHFPLPSDAEQKKAILDQIVPNRSSSQTWQGVSAETYQQWKTDLHTAQTEFQNADVAYQKAKTDKAANLDQKETEMFKKKNALAACQRKLAGAPDALYEKVKTTGEELQKAKQEAEQAKNNLEAAQNEHANRLLQQQLDNQRAIARDSKKAETERATANAEITKLQADLRKNMNAQIEASYQSKKLVATKLKEFEAANQELAKKSVQTWGIKGPKPTSPFQAKQNNLQTKLSELKPITKESTQADIDEHQTKLKAIIQQDCVGTARMTNGSPKAGKTPKAPQHLTKIVVSEDKKSAEVTFEIGDKTFKTTYHGDDLLDVLQNNGQTLFRPRTAEQKAQARNANRFKNAEELALIQKAGRENAPATNVFRGFQVNGQEIWVRNSSNTEKEYLPKRKTK